MEKDKKPNWGLIITIVITIVNVAFWVGTTKTSLEKEAERIGILENTVHRLIEKLNEKMDDEDDGLRNDVDKADKELQEDINQTRTILELKIENSVLKHEKEYH